MVVAEGLSVLPLWHFAHQGSKTETFRCMACRFEDLHRFGPSLGFWGLRGSGFGICLFGHWGSYELAKAKRVGFEAGGCGFSSGDLGFGDCPGEGSEVHTGVCVLGCSRDPVATLALYECKTM